MQISLKETAAALKSVQRIVITAHVNPDGDAIGSSLGLAHALKALGKEVQVSIDDDIPAAFSVLPGYELIGKPAAGQNIQTDLLVALDVSLDRIGQVAEVVSAPTLNIDHHITNDGQADKLYLDGTAAATAEIIYQLIVELGVTCDKDMAMCLYTGLAMDTGWFRFSNTTPNTLHTAAELLACGAVPNLISEALEQRPFSEVQSLAAAMQKIELLADGKVAGVCLDYASLQEHEAPEGLIGMVRVIEGVDIAFTLKEKEPNLCRVSLRSKGIDVTRIALQFGGGGHVRAAGCSIEKSCAEARTDLIRAIMQVLEEER
ncbi:phosphoesterase RecJ domain-containing protein [Selenomonas ruminantium]|uniref:Phosphoesterase RecJ domain-containing protein n=1 Tax=Selenomonas ruminantium TaxID=971 RepID=A0A1M6UVK9_SELRU|nr:bifunctional oligoribonuclease/PAP phosphatase NrnA [Selenomonas ruminantium]SHK73229.1 phosphoesterase RecJ domain-containing protein [Selenomonas ruminantium]